MTLEDSLGDILRKARMSGNVTPEAAAAAAGLSVEDYSAVEDSGKILLVNEFSLFVWCHRNTLPVNIAACC